MARQTEELFETVDSFLKAASVAERGDGDVGAAPRPDEAIRLYTQALGLLNEARSSGEHTLHNTAVMEKKVGQLEARIEVIRRRAQGVGEWRPAATRGAVAQESDDDPFKASVAVLRTAVEADAKYKAGDKPQGSTAVEMYTDGLRLLDLALGSGSYNSHVQTLLRQKQQEVRARLEILRPNVAADKVVDEGIPPPVRTTAVRATQTLPTEDKAKIEGLQVEARQLRQDLQESNERERRASEAALAHASEISANKRHFDEILVTKQAAYEELQAERARTGEDLAAARMEIVALQTELAEQKLQVRAIVEETEATFSTRVLVSVAQKRRYRSEMKSMHSWREAATRKVAARNRMEKAVTRISYVVLRSALANWIRCTTELRRMRTAALRTAKVCRCRQLYATFNKWTVLTLTQRRRRGLALSVVQRLQHRRVGVTFNAWAALASHKAMETRCAEQLEILRMSLERCTAMMDQRVLVSAAQKMKMRALTRSLNSWRTVALRRLGIQAKLQMSRRRLLIFTLSRTLLFWQKFARHATRVQSIHEKARKRIQNMAMARAFHAARTHAKRMKQVRGMVFKWRHRLIKQIFCAWADLVAHEAAERRHVKELSAFRDGIERANARLDKSVEVAQQLHGVAAARSLYESEQMTEAIQECLASSRTEMQALEDQRCEAAKLAAEASTDVEKLRKQAEAAKLAAETSVDVEKLRKEEEALASARAGLAQKDEQIRDLESLINALTHEAIKALPARLEANLAAAKQLAEAQHQSTETEQLEIKKNKLRRLSDVLAGKIKVQENVIVEDMTFTGAFQLIDEASSLPALEREFDRTAKELRLLETQMSSGAFGLGSSTEDDSASLRARRTSLLAVARSHSDHSSAAVDSDEEEPDLVTVVLGADDHGALGIELQPVSIRALNPDGLGQQRASHALETGMVLRTVNDFRADRLAHNALLEMIGAYDGNIAGLTLAFERDCTHPMMASRLHSSDGSRMDMFNDASQSDRADNIYAAVAADLRMTDETHTNAIARAIGDAKNMVLRSCLTEVASAEAEAEELRSTIQALYQEHKSVVLRQRQAVDDVERAMTDYQVREREKEAEHRAEMCSLQDKIAQLETRWKEARWKRVPEELAQELARQHRDTIQSCVEAIATCQMSEETTETARLEMDAHILHTEAEQQQLAQQEHQAKSALHEERVRTAETLDAMKASWARQLQDAQSEHMQELSAKVEKARKATLDSCEKERMQMVGRLNAEHRAAIQTCEEAIATCEAQEARTALKLREDEIEVTARELAIKEDTMQSTLQKLASELENERNLRKYTEGLLREEQDARAELLSKDAAFMEALSMQGELLEELDPLAFDVELNQVILEEMGSAAAISTNAVPEKA